MLAAIPQASWPSLNATCRFWECRFTRTDSAGPNGPPGYGPNCSAKDGSGNWTVHFVVPPDESAGLTNDSVYTNAAAAQVWRCRLTEERSQCVGEPGILPAFHHRRWAGVLRRQASSASRPQLCPRCGRRWQRRRTCL